MTDAIPNIVDGQSSQEDGGIELRVPSRAEEILRMLGVVHLNEKVTQARYCEDETDAAILKEAGVTYVNTSEYEESKRMGKEEERKREMAEKMTMKPLSRAEAEILRKVRLLCQLGSELYVQHVMYFN